MTEDTKKKRGLASLSQDKRREISSEGGREAHRRGTANRWTSETAKAAGRKGGIARQARKKKEQLEKEEKAE